MGALREEKKPAYFLPEGVARMDPMRQHGCSRSAGALSDLCESITTKLSVFSVCSSEPDSREGERARDKEVCECLQFHLLQQMTAQRSDPMTPKVNDGEAS
jgi:hypothetical protein